MKVIFLGTPDFVQPIKTELAKHFTLTTNPAEADLGVVAAYGHILTEEELSAPKYGCINVHPSLLPKYRGASPIQEAILNGDKTSGISIIKIDEEVDHGPLIYQETLELSELDNFDTLSNKMFQRSAEILPQIIEDYVSGKITLQEQAHSQATFCDRLTRESGYFDITIPPDAKKLDRMIRAFYPWPGVWTRLRQDYGGQARWKIVKFLPASSHPELDSGSIKFVLQMEGKKPLSLKDFLNGYPDFPLNNLNYAN
ncbi:MAG: methionyl-tRNA formyltransferase [Candidatus Daviesbacteria bacterium]|nr:methionyl-tRNA formyltransferase [Candidatus Daviesbacteria bacterium]